MRLEITQLARIDLSRITDFGVHKFGASHARAYQFGLTRAFKIIALSPFMAREHIEFRMPTRLHFYKAHIIAYRIEGNLVKIIRVFSKYQDWMELL